MPSRCSGHHGHLPGHPLCHLSLLAHTWGDWILIHLGQRFSNFNKHQNHPEDWLKHRWVDPNNFLEPPWVCSVFETFNSIHLSRTHAVRTPGLGLSRQCHSPTQWPVQEQADRHSGRVTHSALRNDQGTYMSFTSETQGDAWQHVC